MLSREVSNFEVKIPGGTQTVQNRFLWHAEDAFATLKAINDKQIPMFSDAYSILANTFERMYKGFAIELAKLYPEIVIPEDIDKNHAFQNYASLVNRYIPIATCREAYYVTLRNSGISIRWKIFRRISSAMRSRENGFPREWNSC